MVYRIHLLLQHLALSQDLDRSRKRLLDLHQIDIAVVAAVKHLLAMALCAIEAVVAVVTVARTVVEAAEEEEAAEAALTGTPGQRLVCSQV